MPQFPHLQDVEKEPPRSAGMSWARGKRDVCVWAGTPTWLPLAPAGSSGLSLREASSTLHTAWNQVPGGLLVPLVLKMGLGTHCQQGLTGMLQSPAGLPLGSPQGGGRTACAPAWVRPAPGLFQGPALQWRGARWGLKPGKIWAGPVTQAAYVTDLRPGVPSLSRSKFLQDTSLMHLWIFPTVPCTMPST